VVEPNMYLTQIPFYPALHQGMSHGRGGAGLRLSPEAGGYREGSAALF
jgi:hypothetical protein